MSRDFKPRVAPMSSPPKRSYDSAAINLVKDVLGKRNQAFLIAAIQLILCTLFPGRWAIVPAAVLVLSYGTSHLIELFLLPKRKSSGYYDVPVKGRISAQMPNADGSFGPGPAEQGVVVFNLGSQFNHPMGILAPGGQEIGEHFENLNRDLLRRKEELGLLSVTAWQGSTEDSSYMNLTSYYFKDVESIHKFAHEEMHRKAWDWYNSAKPHHIGIFHETFIVPARAYEAVYANCKPTMMSACMVKCDDKAEDPNKWHSTIVSADTPMLKSQWGRLGRDVHGVPLP